MPVDDYTTVNGEIIAETRGGVRKSYVPDPLGSTIALLDNTQAQTVRNARGFVTTTVYCNTP